MPSRFLARILTAFAALLIAAPAVAYDASKAPRYASPDMYRPNVDTVIVQGGASTGGVSGSLTDILKDTLNISFDSVAAFRSATVPSFIKIVHVKGYYGFGTLGGGTFFRDTSDTSSADDGGAVIVSGGNVRWKRIFSTGPIPLEAFGLAPTNGDNCPNLRSAIAYAKGSLLTATAGIFQFSCGYDGTVPANILGSGNGAGPGPAEQYTTQATIFSLNYANPTLFKVTSTRPSIFRNFQIDVAPSFRASTGGAGIDLRAPRITGTETQANSIIQGVAFNNLYRGIYLFSPAWDKITDNYFGGWVDAAIMSETDAGVEGSAGHIERNFIFGKTDSSQRAGVYLRNGYAIVAHNEILGAQYGVLVDIANFPAGFIQIHDNTIEENYYSGVSLKKTGASATVASSMVSVHHNEFSSIITGSTYTGAVFIDENGGVPWLDDVRVNYNTTRNQLPAGGRHFFINGGRTMQFIGNISEELSSNAVIGLQMTGISSNGALVGPILIADNISRGITTRYLLPSSGVATVRDQIPETVANINAWGSAKDGSTAYASDGKSSNAAGQNYTMVGGGTGAPVTKIRGSWLTNLPLN
ncbi:hypothetical protein ACLBXO_22425 [Methylobacterium sp. C33D]